MIIDAYAHCGISKFLPVEEVLTAMKEAGVERTVFCQHLGEYDNSYLAEVIAQHHGRFAAACMVDPDRDDAIRQIQQWHATGSFHGLRLLSGWLLRNLALCLEAIKLGMTLVIYAPDGIGGAIAPILDLVSQCPEAKLVVTHLGNPRVEGGRLAYGSEILSLAKAPNIYIQLSGFGMFCDYPYAPLEELISEVVEEFGPNRLMWGSNFPVCGDRQAYKRDLALVQSGMWGLEPEGVGQVIGGTAQGLWFA